MNLNAQCANLVTQLAEVTGEAALFLRVTYRCLKWLRPHKKVAELFVFFEEYFVYILLVSKAVAELKPSTSATVTPAVS